MFLSKVMHFFGFLKKQTVYNLVVSKLKSNQQNRVTALHCEKSSSNSTTEVTLTDTDEAF